MSRDMSGPREAPERFKMKKLKDEAMI